MHLLCLGQHGVQLLTDLLIDLLDLFLPLLLMNLKDQQMYQHLEVLHLNQCPQTNTENLGPLASLIFLISCSETI
jgi:hypothetical protein